MVRESSTGGLIKFASTFMGSVSAILLNGAGDFFELFCGDLFADALVFTDARDHQCHDCADKRGYGYNDSLHFVYVEVLRQTY